MQPVTERKGWTVRRRAGALAAGFAAVGGLGVALLGAQKMGPRAGVGSPSGEPAEPPADWCAPGYEPIAGGGCFAARADSTPKPLIVYLHGRYASNAVAQEQDRQRRLAARATARGYAVLAFRGRLGTCSAPELASWFCWPSNEQNADRATSFVVRWTHALDVAQARAASAKRFVLGFSNGGYFAGLLATRGLLDAEAFVIAHGGPVEPVRALKGKPPMLLLSADDDVAQDEMIRFDEELAREHWAHDSYARSGEHGLADEDIDAALAFFARAGEKLPLQPPLRLHRAVRHARDAGVAEVESVPDARSERDEVGEPTASGAATEGDD